MTAVSNKAEIPIRVQSFKVLVGEKRMTVIATKNETKNEIEKMLIGKFAEIITML